LGGSVRRLAVTENGQIRAAVSIVTNPIRHTGRNQMYVSHGPAIDNPTSEIFAQLDSAFRSSAKSDDAIGIKIEPYVPAGDLTWLTLLRESGFSVLFPPSRGRSVWVLDLEPTLEELLAHMKPKWRYNIRLASKKGVEIVSGTPDDMHEFFEMYAETAHRDRFYIHPRPIYEQIFRTYWRLGQFELLIARYQGRPVAAVTLVHVGRTVWYLFGASTAAHREVMAPHALQWAAIQWSKQRGASTYDFRGVPDVPARDQEMVGVYRFKQGFGGRHLTTIEQYSKDYQQPMFHIWRSYWQARYAALEIRRIRTRQPHRAWA
jgi:peptidoglycan pentaglycine glycine transferase (the first glycine)